MVDKNLFLHDLAVVAILKNEGHYLKEWLDYHLLAGVDHFYLYDNDSPDNQAEVAKPYVEAGLVDYIYFPGKLMQLSAYNDAVKKFKFQNRYMAFIDCDEFIFPKSNRNITEVVDEILSCDPNAAGLAINWQLYGSNGQDKADYSKGVLERFTFRAPKELKVTLTPSGHICGNTHIKTIANPRTIDFIPNPHFAVYFEDFYSVNENADSLKPIDRNEPVTAEKIVINHYYTKSFEEFYIKQNRGRSDISAKYADNWFNIYNRNDEFDDGILKYQAARAEKFSLESNAEKFNRVTKALTETLSAYASGTKFSLETALTCRALSTYLREKFSNDADRWRVCEEASLAAILKSLDGINFTDSQIFIRELPNLLRLPYPVVKELRGTGLQIISQIKNSFRINNWWKDFVELDYISDLLKE